MLTKCPHITSLENNSRFEIFKIIVADRTHILSMFYEVLKLCRPYVC